MNIPFKIDNGSGNTQGWFELPSSLGDYQVDIKMEGTLPYGRKINVGIYNEDDILIYSNRIKMCGHMGLYITIAHDKDKKHERFRYVFSEILEVKKIFLRDTAYDICDMRKYMTAQAYANQKYTYDFAKNKGLLRITWFVTWLCNYKCPYCWERVDESEYRNKLSKLNQISPEEWADAFNRLGPEEIYITGGEPTVYQRLPEVIKNLDQGIYLKIFTNFGNTFHLDTYNEFIRQGRIRGVAASFHPSEISLEKFLEKIDKALVLGYGDNCDFAVELVMYPEDIHYAEKLIDYCRQKKIRLQLDYYSDPRAQYKETEEERKLIDALIQKSKINNQALRSWKQMSIKISEEELLALEEVVLCGAGSIGSRLCNSLLRKKYSGIKGICDNYIGDSGRYRNNIQIYSFETAVKKFPDTYFVIAVENISIASEMAIRLTELGINKKRIKVFEKSTIEKRKFIRGRQPMWCPAGMMSIHIDPDGEVYPCMVAVNNKKIFGADTMPSYKTMGNILEKTEVLLRKTPVVCWESFRCSACDYPLLEPGMTNVDIVNTEEFLPLPE